MNPSANASPILLFGGSFNPPHLAHFRLLHAALDGLKLSHGEMIPSGQPWQKPHVVAAAHRMAMLTLAAQDDAQAWLSAHPEHPYPIHINPMETELDAPSYTVDTLTELRRQHPSVPLIWLIGSDQLANLHTWRNWQGILQLAHLAVAQRAGHTVNSSDIADASVRSHYATHHCRAQDSAWRNCKHGLFIEVEAPAMAISSTAIRAQITQGQATPELSPSVQNYIFSHDLYQSSN